jgi:hypothetical protein
MYCDIDCSPDGHSVACLHFNRNAIHQPIASPKNRVVYWIYGVEGNSCHVWNGKRFTKTLSDELLLNVIEATRIKNTMLNLGFTCVFLTERCIL